MQMFRENTVYMADFIPTKKKLGGEQHSLLNKSAISVFIKQFCIMYKQLVIIILTQESWQRSTWTLVADKKLK